ncbi:MAG: ABC transporter ATP-binding protein, partial [Stellaceae bacterium]
LLNSVAGYVKPTTGRILVDGDLVTEPGPDRGMVFQQYSLFPWKTVRENVAFGPRILARGDPESTADTFIEMVGLSKFANRYPAELSGGMQQRVAIVRALIHDPALLLMDEPFGALDAMTREQMNLELQKINMATQATVIFVTHSIAEAVFLSDRVFVMTGRPASVREVVAIDIPRPRNLDMIASGRFGGFLTRLRRLLDATADPT